MRFEDPFRADGARVGASIEQAMDRAKADDRLVLGLHGGRAENGELQAMCEMRKIAFTGLALGLQLAWLRQAKTAGGDRGRPFARRHRAFRYRAGFAEHVLIAKPARDGSSYGLIFADLVSRISLRS